MEEFGLTGAVPAEVWRLSALRHLDLRHNRLTSVPAEIGQLTSLERLHLFGNQLTLLPAETAHVADGVGPRPQSADERAGRDRAAHVAGEVVPRPKMS